MESSINSAKEKRLSNKGSEEHINAERILFDILWKIKDFFIEKDIKPNVKAEYDCK